ncbi:phosphopantetheine adenylyltransferase [Nocardia higoensis]|uniref:Phosphopantetheine adenylyltransferase n=1 Tax=Nocardia higoensis TaxID=228599 RepID=A0ABS0DAN1_9NOCA|nr:phosphopantetheine adenylyltransferase [Nocardia higoensis]MBF6355538.1 phosphopantetheine adenylyltransferase [Nocardia higoensis]
MRCRFDGHAAALIAVGVLNAVPALGVVSVQRMREAYGLHAVDENVGLLLRHRAVLFGVLGIGLIVGARRPRWREPAIAANAVSLVSFPALAAATESVAPQLTRVAAVDVAAAALLGGVWLSIRRSQRRGAR